MPLYWPLASIAAYRALFELFLRPHHWAKTEHSLSPRQPTPFPARAPHTVVHLEHKRA
jgi:hypothetical protein